jgi:hypothetical protein
MHQGVIIVNPHVKPDHGDYIVLKNAEDEAVFKQLKKYGKARILHPLNPNYPDILSARRRISSEERRHVLAESKLSVLLRRKVNIGTEWECST